jgi:hypothetical protein
MRDKHENQNIREKNRVNTRDKQENKNMREKQDRMNMRE